MLFYHFEYNLSFFSVLIHFGFNHFFSHLNLNIFFHAIFFWATFVSAYITIYSLFFPVIFCFILTDIFFFVHRFLLLYKHGSDDYCFPVSSLYALNIAFRHFFLECFGFYFVNYPVFFFFSSIFSPLFVWV